MNLLYLLSSYLFTVYLNVLSTFEDSHQYLRRNLLAYQESGSTYTVTANSWAVMTSNNKLRLIKDFKFRVEQDGISFFESQRIRTDSAINHNNLVPGVQAVQPAATTTLKEDPTIAVEYVYLPKVTTSANCYNNGNGYTCVPNKDVWTTNPGNFAFLYYNTMDECLATNGQPFYFYSEFQTSCTSGIRQSINKYTKIVTVKSYAHTDCTGSVTTKYSYPLSSTSYPAITDLVCHASPYSASIVKAVMI